MITGKHIVRVLIAILPMIVTGTALAATYTIPSGPLPPGCSFDAAQSIVQCPGNLILRNNDNIVVSSPTTMQIGADFSFGNNLDVNIGGNYNDLFIYVGGNLNPGNGATINASLGVQGNINALNNAELTGPMVVSGNLILGNNSTVSGGIDVSGTLNTGQNVTITGSISANSVNLGQYNLINGNIETVNININGSNTVVDGNVNATGSVNNNGTITGYVNAPTINNNGNIGGPSCDENNNVGGCGGGGASQPQFYRLTHSGHALTCENEPILVEACDDASCATTLPITGQVTIRAQGPVQSFANATFSASGQATTSIALTSAGTYTLSISAADIAPVSSTAQCQSPNGCSIISADSGLRFTTIASQVAGAPFQTELQIVRTDDNTGACQLVADSIDEIELALSCLNPSQCASDPGNGGMTLFRAQGTPLTEHPAFATVPASFDAQSSLSLTLNHEDVGQVQIHVKAQAQNGAALLGTSNEFVVRPAGFAIEVNNSIGYSGGIFARAGDPLQVQIQAISASGAPTPSFGKETPAQLPTLASTADTTSPASGIDGSVVLISPFALSASVAGAYNSGDVRYTEAGRARFEAVLQTPPYLGSEPVSSWSEPVGRFVPYEFELDLEVLSPACSAGSPSFTYLGQDFTVSTTVLAHNYMGELTRNYPDTGVGDPVQFLAFDSDKENDLSPRLLPNIILPAWTSGTGSLNTQLRLERADLGEPEAPIDALQLAILLDPLTAVGAAVPMANADTSQNGPACAPDQLCNARLFATPKRWVYGRLLFGATSGSEFEEIPIIAGVQYWDGERFTRHRADSCTVLDPAKITITDNPDNLAVQAIGSASPVREGEAKREQFRFSAPEQDGEIDYEYEAPTWLRFGGTDNTDMPSASATFGTYAGHDRVHSWQELYR